MVRVRVGSRVGSGWPTQNTGRVTGQPVFASGQKNRVRVKYFSGWVGSGQKILTRFAMSSKSKALAATLSDIELEDDSDNEDDGILNAFTDTVNPTKGIVEDVDEEEDLVEYKFEKMDEQDDSHTTYAKLYKV